jgi:hypothetical protein
MQQKADSTLRSSRAVPHPSANRALRRLASEVRRDPVHSTSMAVSETNQERHWPGSMASTRLLEKTLLYCCRLGSTTVVFLKIVDRKTNTTHLHFFKIPSLHPSTFLYLKE